MRGLEKKLTHLLERGGYTNAVYVASCDENTALEAWSEIYHADSQRAQQRVTVKIKRMAAHELPADVFKERDAIADIKHITIPTQFSTHSIVDDDGIIAAFYPRAYFPYHVPLHQLAQVHEHRFIDEAINLAGGVIAAGEREKSIGDIKPTNIIITNDTKHGLHIDFDNVTRFGHLPLRHTPEFTLPGIACPRTDTYALQKTIIWVAQKHGFLHHSPFYELRGEEPGTPQELIDILDAPRRARRRTIKQLGAIAATLALGTGIVGVVEHNRNAYNRSENAALDNFDGSEAAQYRLGVALAHKIGDLVDTGFYSNNQVKIPGRYSPNGETLDIDISYPEGGALTTLLYTAARVDTRALPAATANANAQLRWAEQEGFARTSGKNTHAPSFLLSYMHTNDPRFLRMVLQIGRHLIDDNSFFAHRLYLPHLRPVGSERLPVILAEDCFCVDSLLSAHTARSTAIRENVAIEEELLSKDYLSTAEAFCSSLRDLIVNRRVYGSISYETIPPRRAPADTLFQVQVASTFWRVGTITNNEELKQESKLLLDEVLSLQNPILSHFTNGKPDSYALATGCLLARLQERKPAEYSSLLRELIRHVPRATIENSSLVRIRRTRKELLSDVCLPTKSASWCNIGTPLADADFLQALLYQV